MNNIIIISNFLTPQETQLYLDQAIEDPLLQEEMDLGDSKFSRSTWKNKQLAQKLYPKLIPHLPKLENHHLIKNLSPRWYINRYLPGGFFYQHVDGTASYDNQKSLYTFIIYLNDDFDQGETLFYNKQDQIIKRIKPQAGLAIIFPQNILHSGNKVLNGSKYIMRSDLMI